MALPHDHHEDRHLTTESASIREPFGVAQIVCLIAGIVFVVLGAISLARSGFGEFTGPQADIGSLGATPLLSLIHVGIGLAALAGATGRSPSRGALMFIGPLLVAGGIIALIEPIDALGYTEANGILYLITGIVAIVAAMMTPLATVEDRRVTAL